MSHIPCTVYIDEAGDLGANRGTQWFVLTAVIVDQDKEKKISAAMRAVKAKLNLQSIHFRNVKDFNRRSFIVDQLADEEFSFAAVLFDTKRYDREKLPTENLAYNYVCRILLERVSWLLRDTNRRGEIILSSRGTARDQDLSAYILEKLIPYQGNQIENVFTGVGCKPASSWDMLQLADVCATSMFYSHEINGFGFVTPCFIKRLQHKLYAHQGKVARYGVKYLADDMRPSTASLDCHKLCKK